jgi:flagellar motor switch protein FliN/FliY
VPAALADILKIEVPVIVQIGERSLTVEDVAALVPGAIVELPKEVDEQLEILVNNKPIGRGYAVKVGENFGIRVTSIGDQRARIEALAAPDAASDPSGETIAAAP